MPMITYVTTGASPRVMVALVFTRVRCREHSGQRMPTGVGVMQSGQIGRPQFEQDTAVRRSGWNAQGTSGIASGQSNRAG